MCPVGELRASEEGLASDLAGDDARAVQCVEVHPWIDNNAGDDVGMVDDVLGAGVTMAADDDSLAGVPAAATGFFT
jgi:hypothetical protein